MSYFHCIYKPIVNNDSTENELHYQMRGAFNDDSRESDHTQNPHGESMAEVFDEIRCCLHQDSVVRLPIDLKSFSTAEREGKNGCAPIPRQIIDIRGCTNKRAKEFSSKRY